MIVTDVASADKLGVWISRYDPAGQAGRPRTLLLFEGVHAKDEPPTYLSSYSWLLLLFIQTAGKLGGPGVLGGVVQSLLDRGEVFFDSLSADLAKNPLGFLEKLGPEMLPERWIRTLYRVRNAALVGAPRMVTSAVTLGYPIYISQASSEDLDTDQGLYANDAVAAEDVQG